MKKRFSNKELYLLRNNIPIELLIEKILEIPSKKTQGVFRFLCPSCNEFYTSVHYKTNQAKCFSCKKIFNTIDLTLNVRKIPFVQAVEILQKCYDDLCQQKETSVQNHHTSNNDFYHQSAKTSEAKKNNCEKPAPISDILPDLLQKIPYNGRVQNNNPSHKPHFILKKLEQIEQNLNKLVQEVKQIKEFF